jgi:hypothetical protein
LSDEQFLALSAAIAASTPSGILLIDAPESSLHIRNFLREYRPERVVPVGTFPQGVGDLERRLGVTAAPAVQWKQWSAPAFWKAFFPRAERVVLCPREPRSALLQAACLAGAAGAPLWVTDDDAKGTSELGPRLSAWATQEILAVGSAVQSARSLRGVKVTALENERAVASACRQYQLKKGAIENLVVANPADLRGDLGGLSVLAPWIALQRRAALLLTNAAGKNTADVVRDALKDRDRGQADSLILVANLKAIPMERRDNPVSGKDPFIEMEPMTPEGEVPFTFATGRLFHEDLSIVLLTLARQRLLADVVSVSSEAAARKALVVSNPGGGLPLLETFSRNTGNELKNRGYQTTTLFEKDVAREEVRRLLPEQDIFLWEGHYRTMVDEYGLPCWTEPLKPSLIFLQSCLALNPSEAQPLLQRGAVSIVGSSTRTYSATGGAFTLAFFDALLYDDRSLGAALRQAKNFLLTYSLLKEKRLGPKAKLTGANLRSAWAFTLWGDPTLKLPKPPQPANASPAVRHTVRGNTIVLAIPQQPYGKVTIGRYQAELWPNARLAGLLSSQTDEDRHLVPFLFAEVDLRNGPPGQVPVLHSRLPGRNWVFAWDARRRTGYLLAIPRSQDQEELRFQVRWSQVDEKPTGAASAAVIK